MFGKPSTSGRSSVDDLPAALDPDDLVVREARSGGRKIAALEVINLGAANQSIAFRAGSVDVPQYRIGKSAGLTPTQFVQDLSGGATHRRRDGVPVFSPSRHKDHIRRTGSET